MGKSTGTKTRRQRKEKQIELAIQNAVQQEQAEVRAYGKPMNKDLENNALFFVDKTSTDKSQLQQKLRQDTKNADHTGNSISVPQKGANISLGLPRNSNKKGKPRKSELAATKQNENIKPISHISKNSKKNSRRNGVAPAEIAKVKRIESARAKAASFENFASNPRNNQAKKADRNIPKKDIWDANYANKNPLEETEFDRDDPRHPNWWKNNKLSRPSFKKRAEITNSEKIRAISDGTSFNPLREAHQDLLGEAVALEIKKKEERDFHTHSAPSSVLAININDEEDPLLVDNRHIQENISTDREQVDDDDDGDDDDYQDNDQENNRASNTIPPKNMSRKPVSSLNKKTTAQRNKQKRVNELESIRKALRAEKKKMKDVENIPFILSQIRKAERDSKNRKLLRLRDPRPIRRIGGRVVPQEGVDIMLTEDIPMSARQLRPRATLMKDHYHTHIKAGKVTPVSAKARSSR